MLIGLQGTRLSQTAIRLEQLELWQSRNPQMDVGFTLRTIQTLL